MEVTPIREVQKRLGISFTLAKELVLLAGGDIGLVCQCSEAASGLDECKARIIDARVARIEQKGN